MTLLLDCDEPASLREGWDDGAEASLDCRHRAVKQHQAQQYLDRLVRAFQLGGPHQLSPTTSETVGHAGLVELSDRELQVLRLLAEGKSNQQIADELGVVIDTVKKHVGHILDKLGAANRTQAVARARSLGLLR
jgi:LuxR family maltose regulon positive regulatory protein